MWRKKKYRGDVIFSCSDTEGVIDVVDETAAVRSLQFGTEARQSTMFRHDPNTLALSYTQCMLTSLLFADADPRQALVFGLGGGSMVKYLLAQCPACRIDAVERRPAVIDVAHRFFQLPEAHPRLNVYSQDATSFLSTAPDTEVRYDLILVDLHDSSGMAPVVRNSGFFEICRALLSSTGMLAINLWYGYREKEESEARQALESAFAHRILYLPVAGKLNCVGFAGTQMAPEPEAVIAQRAVAWKERSGINFPALLVELTRFNGGLSI